jgi:hypothetical protein
MGIQLVLSLESIGWVWGFGKVEWQLFGLLFFLKRKSTMYM